MPLAKFPDCRVLKATEKALLIDIEGEEHWIPQSVVHEDSEVFDDEDNSEGMLVLQEWFAEREGLI